MGVREFLSLLIVWAFSVALIVEVIIHFSVLSLILASITTASAIVNTIVIIKNKDIY